MLATEIRWMVLILAVLGGLMILQFVPSHITGEITALGGRLTNINLTATNKASHWAGLFGEVEENTVSPGSINLTVQQGQTLERNISLDCIGDELYASRTLVPNLDASVAGTADMIDTNLSISSQYPESAARMFTLNKTFEVGATTYTLPTTTTLSKDNGTFDEGILNNSGTPIFTTHVVSDKKGFDGNKHDYQLLLPVSDQETSYVLYSDCTTTNRRPHITIHAPQTEVNFFTKHSILNVSVSHTAKLWYSLDNGSNRTLCMSCKQAVTTLDLNFVSHTITVFANDSSGNFSFLTRSFMLRSDLDNDGVPDYLDTDNDNDGIVDSNDTWDGFAHNLDSDIPHTNITIDHSYNLSQKFEGRLPINISNSTDTIIEFFFNFSAGAVCTLSNITLTKQNITYTDGWAIARGVCLAANEKKTVYIDDIDSTKNSVCIRDREITSITEISSDCSDTNEVRLACPGTSTDYTCTVVDGRYKVTGLTHSGVIETSDAAAPSTTQQGKTTRPVEKPAAAGGEAAPEEAPKQEVPEKRQPVESPPETEPPAINYTGLPPITLPDIRLPRITTIQFFLTTRIIIVVILIIVFLFLLRRIEKNKNRG